MASRISNIFGHEKCESYLLFPCEAALGEKLRTFLYFAALAYCFIGLSAITARFFKSMENVVKHTRTVVEIDPFTNAEVVKQEKVWNYTIADISLLAFGTSFPQISLATIDAIRNLGQLDAGGLGPGTLVGSAAFDLFPIHAVCVVVPKAGQLKKISDIGVWLVELFWSFWAYAWLYIILEVWTPNVVTLWEALLTVLQYGLLLIHAYAQDKRWPYLSLPLERSERPEEWVPTETSNHRHDNEVCHNTEIFQVVEDGNSGIADIFSIHHENGTGPTYQRLPSTDAAQSPMEQLKDEIFSEESHLLTIWRQQFLDALRVLNIFSFWLKCLAILLIDFFLLLASSPLFILLLAGLILATFPGWELAIYLEVCGMVKSDPKQISYIFTQLQTTESRKMDKFFLRLAKIFWQLLLVPWRLLFAFVPPYQIAHGWIAFICSLIFISGIAYIVTKLTDLINCVTGINAYVIAFTALASGTSWPDLVASKIAAERQITADSAIANITCSNSVNIYVGIGVPWLIDTLYNFFAYNQPLRIQNASGLSFSLLVFFSTSVGCIGVLVLRRLILGAELGGPRLWAWITCVYFLSLWLIFVVLSSLKVSGFL